MSNEEYQKILLVVVEIKKQSAGKRRQDMIDFGILDEEGYYPEHYPHLREAQLQVNS